ncbi:hypothetical protein [Celeribacter halophilus]|uniref:hypothetical protein n=1 Tax=Celeribacter halophilus TaxID=576117 RepID=UPI003A8EDC09
MKHLAGIFLGFCIFSTAAQADDHKSLDVYHGAYFEDPASNPEDPTFGSISLVLPSDGGVFSGEMSFSFVGCQTRNIGHIEGTKTEGKLTGHWSGTVDQTEQSGAFDGEVQSDGVIAGDYTVDGGKQFNRVEGCIQYYIAPEGTFYLKSAPDVENGTPVSFENDLVGVSCAAQISVAPKTPAAAYLVAVQIIALGPGGPTVITPRQNLTYAQTTRFSAKDLFDLIEEAGLEESAETFVTVTAVNARNFEREEPIILPTRCLSDIAAVLQ